MGNAGSGFDSIQIRTEKKTETKRVSSTRSGYWWQRFQLRNSVLKISRTTPAKWRSTSFCSIPLLAILEPLEDWNFLTVMTALTAKSLTPIHYSRIGTGCTGGEQMFKTVMCRNLPCFKTVMCRNLPCGFGRPRPWAKPSAHQRRIERSVTDLKSILFPFAPILIRVSRFGSHATRGCTQPVYR